MKFNQNTTVIIVAIILLSLIVFKLGAKDERNSQTAVYDDSMVLTETGYVPDELTIKLGDTVTFSTDRGKHHWPASNLHPEHDIYPEFDPGGPLAPEESWSFTFDQAGTWNMHDHLRSYYRARINVIE